MNAPALEALAVTSITVLAVISPGADFALVSRHSLVHGRRHGVQVACGIALGVWVHVAAALLGLQLLLQAWPPVLTLLRLGGAGYLMWLGWQTATAPTVIAGTLPPDARSLRAGLLCNATNPKTTLFVMSVFSQVVSPATPLPTRLGYGAFMSLSHALWFALVAALLSTPALRAGVLAHQQPVNRAIGAILVLLGLGLLASAAG